MKIEPEKFKADWNNVAPEKVVEILRLSELYLQGQLMRLEQADQRSLGLLSVAVPSALALFGASLSALSSTDLPSAIGYGGIVAAVFLLIATKFAFAALDPTPFYIAGNSPENLLDKNDLEARSRIELLAEYAEFNQAGIERNAVILADRSKNIRKAITVFLLSPIAGAAVIAASMLLANIFSA